MMNPVPSKSEPGTAIRLATGHDAAQIAALYAPIVRDTIISFEVEPPTAHEMRRRIEKTLERFPWLACERDGKVAGYAYAAEHSSRAAYQWSVNVSVYVHESERCTGVGRALYQSLLSILASITPTPGSHSPTPRASVYTRPLASYPLASTAGSATSSVRGTTWDGGSCRCGSGSLLPTLLSPYRLPERAGNGPRR
jgi:GNAT superfamily N-acetyltransferase